jgi:molybdopterin molybdotransferase
VIPYSKALGIVLDNVRPLPTATLPVAKALGAYLAKPVKAPAHSPRFDQSAMDGYAVRMADVKGARPEGPIPLELVDELPAGDQRKIALKPGCTVKVFTGSRLPRGAEAVVMKEYVTLEKGQAAIAWKVKPGENIRQVGDEYRRGDVILLEGLRITPPVVGLLVNLGKVQAAVRRSPEVTVITMGDELVPPGSRPGPGQIPDANGPALVAALKALGVTRVRHRRVKDKVSDLVRVMKDGLKKSDLVLTVGGASVGDYDYVHAARRKLGLKDLFTKVAIKPGKPNIFGLDRRRTPIFGLPGNPVSALVSFHQLVKPAVLKMMGARVKKRPLPRVRLENSVLNNPGRMKWYRGTLQLDGDQLTARFLTGQGSHMLSGLALADLLIEVPPEATQARSGEFLEALELDWDE